MIRDVVPQGDRPRARAKRARIPGLPWRIHLLGAGGAGVSGAARILVDHGHAVTAHDRAESEHVALLRALGIEVEISPQERARLPADAELVARSAAVPEHAPAVADARARAIPVLKYSELLGRISPAGRTLAVAGTHGKTTTSWMLHHALRAIAESAPAAAAPGALIGGICRTLATNAVAPEPGGWFAVEACEYDRSFLQLAPQGAIVTNVEADHLDYYGDLDAIVAAFARFADRVHPSGLVALGRDVPRSTETAARARVWRLGREIEVALLAERAGRFSFRCAGPGFAVERIDLAVPGEFNVENAALALALAAGATAREHGLDLAIAANAAARGIERYRGAERRFEPWSRARDEGGGAAVESGEIPVIHDYAHHPTEVRATLEAARRVFPGRALHVLFQPHQHSRTARFFAEFVESLRAADRVVVSDVYGARAHIDGEHTAGAVELAAALATARVDAVHGGDLRTSVAALCAGVRGDCAVLVLGAGDVVQVEHDLLAQLAGRGATPRGSRR